MDNEMANHFDPSEIAELEQACCRALVGADLDELKRIVSDDLVHVHANGHIDDHDAYLGTVLGKIRSLDVQRRELHVRVYGDLALATGPLDQTIELTQTGQRVDMHIVTTQVWRKEGGSPRYFHPPAPADRALAAAERFFQHGQQLERPAMHGRMIDRDPTFGHHFLNPPQAQRIRNVPAHAHQNYFQRIVQAFQYLGQRRVQRLHQFTHRRPCIAGILPAGSYCDTTALRTRG
jgi:ketosteroid isomerase-like protein